MTEKKFQLLIIEDDIDYVDIIRLCLDEPDSMGLKFDFERADRLEVGLNLLAACPFDAVLLDLTLPDSRGINTVKQVLAMACEVPILVLTNLGDESLAFEAMRLGAQDFMVKATSDSRLLKRAIWYAIERRKLLAQSESLITKAADAMLVIDSQSLVRYANPAAETLFGCMASELLEKHFAHTPIAAGDKKTIKMSGPNEKSAEMRVTEIQWKGGPALLASIRDITDLQKIEQLRAEIKERRRLDELKDTLIGTISHELRTPLAIIKGAVDNLRDGLTGALQGPQIELANLAHHNLNRLSKIVNNLLDLSRLESGKAKINLRRVSPAALIRQVVEDYYSQAENPKPALEIDLPRELPDIAADPELLAEVIINLFDNALRFARSRVRVAAVGCGPGVEISVRDDGPGIPQNKIGDLFNKFVQIDRAFGGGGYKGTGLGLAICKDIMDLHHSRIALDSGGPQGTLFSFILPAYSPAAGCAEGKAS